jgi:uncharacterized protein YicC (UPF0701 family)
MTPEAIGGLAIAAASLVGWVTRWVLKRFADLQDAARKATEDAAAKIAENDRAASVRVAENNAACSAKLLAAAERYTADLEKLATKRQAEDAKRQAAYEERADQLSEATSAAQQKMVEQFQTMHQDTVTILREDMASITRAAIALEGVQKTMERTITYLQANPGNK